MEHIKVKALRKDSFHTGKGELYLFNTSENIPAYLLEGLEKVIEEYIKKHANKEPAGTHRY